MELRKVALSILRYFCCVSAAPTVSPHCIVGPIRIAAVEEMSVLCAYAKASSEPPA